jgi:hypothetical protein
VSGFSRTDTRYVTTAAIPGNTQSNIRTAWLFGVLWNLISTPLLFIIPEELERNRLAAIGFLFPLIGVGLLTWAVITTMRWRRFGASQLEIGPATLGGQLSGTIHTRLPDVPSLRVTLKLTCLDRLTRGSGEDRDTRENILWREEYVVPEGHIGRGALGASIPVNFAIPADARATTAVGRSDGILWVLVAEASLPGVDFKEDFDVPVRRDPSGTPDTMRPNVPTSVREPISPMDLAASGIHVTPTPEGTQYYFSTARNARFGGGLTMFTLLWTGALWLQYTLGFPWIFVVVTGAFELLLILIVLDVWFGATTVTIGSESVSRRHAILGIGSTRVIPKRSITSLDVPISMQSTGRSGTPYYELRATLDTGRHKHLGRGIRNKRHAEWLLERMRSEIERSG